MSLPRSVQKQADEAKAHFDALQNPAPAAPEAEEKTPDATDTAAQPADTQPKPEDNEHSQGSDETPGDQPKRSETYWEHRFNVMSGKYAAEVPALRREVSELKGQLEAKGREIDALKQASNPANNPGGLTDEQIQKGKEEFGEDFVLFVQKMIDSKAIPATDDSKVRQLEDQLNEIKERDQQKAQATFWTVLTELVPDWKQINANQAFHAFLSQFDSQTGKQRQQTLADAQQALDADGVAAVFNDFKKQQPAPKPRIPDDQVDPQTSRATETPQGQTVWTDGEIKKFYKDAAAGKYSASERERLEADIFAALNEGRVQ
jgi:hypothetical protein